MTRDADKWKKGTLFDPGFLDQAVYVSEMNVPYSLALEWFGAVCRPWRGFNSWEGVRFQGLIAAWLTAFGPSGLKLAM